MLITNSHGVCYYTSGKISKIHIVTYTRPVLHRYCNNKQKLNQAKKTEEKKIKHALNISENEGKKQREFAKRNKTFAKCDRH